MKAFPKRIQVTNPGTIGKNINDATNSSSRDDNQFVLVD